MKLSRPKPHDGIAVTLTFSEWTIAAIAGLLRQMFALMWNSSPDWEDGTEFEHHVLGSLGEATWHKWRGIWWPAPLNEFKKADAAGNVQIRTTPRRYPFHKVKPIGKDKADWMVVFIEGGTRTHYIVGCMSAGEAQRRYPLSDPGNRGKPCHVVPVEDMHSVAEFIRSLDGRPAPVNGERLVSRCYSHGEYSGDGNCPRCEETRIA